MDKDTFRSSNTKDSSASDLKIAFNAFPAKPTAFFEHDGTCYWAVQNEAYDAIFHLYGAAIKGNKKKKLKIITNYDWKTSANAKGAEALHGFELEHKTTKLTSITAPVVKKCTIIMKRALNATYPVPAGIGAIVSDIQSDKPSIKENGEFKVSGMKTVHRLYLATAYAILNHGHVTERDGVVALIVGKDGRILSWGRKNPNVPCWHGETSAIMGLGGKIPAGSAVYSTLKPCNMCSGLIWEASKGNAKVYWGQDDPGDAAKDTKLDTEKCGFLLDGNKTHSSPLYLGPKPADNGARPAVATTLGQGFDAQKGTGKKSTIDYILTDPARDIVKGVESMLQQKYNKYHGTNVPTHFNENTEFVVRYLIGFLDSLNIKFATLGT